MVWTCGDSVWMSGQVNTGAGGVTVVILEVEGREGDPIVTTINGDSCGLLSTAAGLRRFLTQF